MVTDKQNRFGGYDPEYYDLTFSEQKFDVPFYTQLAKEANGKVLEVACGSGRAYLDLLKEGIDIYGIDLSEKMLAALKEKARDMGLEPKVFLADMRDFKLNNYFDLIIIPARSFLHNLTSDDHLNTLKSCRKHLAENGRLALNFFCPNYRHIEETYGKEMKQYIETPDGH